MVPMCNAHPVRTNLLKSHEIIEGIRSASGAPGLAVGIIHHGHIIHEHYCGYRDVEAQLPIDGDTIFHVASLTKAVTAAAVGVLVDRGALKWDTPVDQILPTSKDSPCTKSKLSVVDFLSHRTGATWADALYLQSNNNIQLPKEESLRTFEYLATVAAPRSRFLYNNHAYNIPGLVIEALSKQNYGSFVNEHICAPLGMTRTFTEQPTDSNVAIPHNILTDGTPFRIPFCEVSDKTMMFSAISMRTCMTDLFRLYHAWLEAMGPLLPETEANHLHTPLWQALLQKIQSLFSGVGAARSNLTTTSPMNEPKKRAPAIKEASRVLCPYVPRKADSLFEQTHALGWNRSVLPAALDFGWNASMVADMPVLGKGLQGKLAIWHGGNMPGTTSAVILLPETRTAVIVLQNSLGRCDAADWIAQLLVDYLFTGQPQHDYVSLAIEASSNGTKRMEKVQMQLEKEREHGTLHRPVQEYVGIYRNAIMNWAIEIGTTSEGQLYLRFQRRPDEQYILRHYHYDIFVWNLTYDEMVKRAQYCRPHAYYKIQFGTDAFGLISSICWQHDPNVPEGEIFLKATK